MVDTYTKGAHGVDHHWSQVEYNAGVVWHEGRGKFIDATILVPGMGSLDLEEMACLLAEAVHKYNPALSDDAFESAKIQLLTRDYAGEWAELKRKIRVHKIWGGPVPSAVFVPDDSGERWEMVMPDRNGIPYKYAVSEKAVGDAVPLPHADNSVKVGEKYYYKPEPKQAAKNREQRRMLEARARKALKDAADQ